MINLHGMNKGKSVIKPISDQILHIKLGAAFNLNSRSVPETCAVNLRVGYVTKIKPTVELTLSGTETLVYSSRVALGLAAGPK